ncbi:MAG: hypothetical protein K9L74_01855 [Candidatus Izimaplasma sp.]|nr:hypothetical protein [Candidatus Izimaplasma bacterium]
MNQKKFNQLGFIMLLTASDNQYELQIYKDKIVGTFEPITLLPPITTLLSSIKGGITTLVTSDIFDVTNLEFPIRSMEKHTLARVQDLIVQGVIPYLATVAQEEQEAIMIQSSFSSNNPSLTISAGLLNDVQILLLDIHKKKEEIVS